MISYSGNRLSGSRRQPRDGGWAAAIIVIAVMLAGPARAANSGSLVSRLQRHYSDTESFTAKFKETLTSPGGAPRVRTGKVAYRKPGMIRWEFDPPQAETIVADGTTLYDYDPGLNQVIEMPEQSAFKNRSIAAFILGVGNLKRDFDVESINESGVEGLAHLALKAKENGPRIELGVDPKSLNITTLRAADAIGNVTEVQLTDIERNVAVAKSTFDFAVPAGADVVTAPPTH